MSHINKALAILSEKDEFISNELKDRALKYMSIEEIRKFSKNPKGLEKKVEQIRWARIKDAEKAQAAKEKEEKKNVPKGLTTTQFNKICKDAANDYLGDNKDQSIQDVGSDLADSLLYNPEILAYVKKKLGDNYSKTRAREFVADTLTI